MPKNHSPLIIHPHSHTHFPSTTQLSMNGDVRRKSTHSCLHLLRLVSTRWKCTSTSPNSLELTCLQYVGHFIPYCPCTYAVVSSAEPMPEAEVDQRKLPCRQCMKDRTNDTRHGQSHMIQDMILSSRYLQMLAFVEQRVVYSIYYIGTLVLPYRGGERTAVKR